MNMFSDIALEIGVKPLLPEAGSEEEAFLKYCKDLVTSLIVNGYKHGKPMSLQVGLVDSSDCNAWAVSADDVDYIGIHVGLISTLRNLSRALISQRYILPHVGHPEAVTPIQFAFDAATISNESSSIGTIQLEDPEREGLAAYLTNIAAAFIVYHEFQHIFNGHTDWLETQGRLALIAELKVPKHDQYVGVTRQTLERDADVGALQLTLVRVLQPIIHWVDGIAVWDVAGRSPMGPPQDLVELVCVGSQLINLMYAKLDDFDAEGVFEADHPHPVVRTLLNVTAVCGILSFRTGQSYDDLVTTTMRSFERSLDAWADTFPSTGHLNVDAIADPDVVNALDGIVDAYATEWSRIQPELDKLKRGGKLAPRNYADNPAFFATS